MQVPPVRPSYDEWLGQMRLRGYDATINPAFFREHYDRGTNPDDFARLLEQRRQASEVKSFQMAPASKTSPLVWGFFVFLLLGGFGIGAKDLLNGSWTQSTSSMAGKVSQGMSHSDVRAALGEPDSVQDMSNSVNVGAETITSDVQLWYYKGNSLQIAFDKGKVNGINQY